MPDFLYDENGNISVFRILLLVAGILFAVGALWAGIDALDGNNIQQRLLKDQDLYSQTTVSVAKANGEVMQNALVYADHWSATQATKLLAVEKNFEPTGEIHQDLATANTAFAKSDRETAKTYADKAEQLIQEGQAAANAILGPPDLYDQLAEWSNKADGAITDAQSCITTNQSALLKMKESVNYNLGVTDLTNAQNLVNQAATTNTAKVERGIIDKPQAYTLATQSRADCDNALLDAAPPTATPTVTPIPPTSTPRPPSHDTIIIVNNNTNNTNNDTYNDTNNDTSSGGSGYNSGGDTGGSFDFGSDSGGSSYDSGSDSNFDSGGGSDSDFTTDSGSDGDW